MAKGSRRTLTTVAIVLMIALAGCSAVNSDASSSQVTVENATDETQEQTSGEITIAQANETNTSDESNESHIYSPPGDDAVPGDDETNASEEVIVVDDMSDLPEDVAVDDPKQVKKAEKNQTDPAHVERPAAEHTILIIIIEKPHHTETEETQTYEPAEEETGEIITETDKTDSAGIVDENGEQQTVNCIVCERIHETCLEDATIGTTGEDDGETVIIPNEPEQCDCA